MISMFGPACFAASTAPVVSDIIGDLPEIRSGLSRGNDSYRNWQKEISELSRVAIKKQLNGHVYAAQVVEGINHKLNSLKYPEERISTIYPGKLRTNCQLADNLYDPRLSILTDHQSRTHKGSDLRRYMYASVFAEATGTSPKLSDFPVDLFPAHRNVGTEKSVFSVF